ncbi:unnamed protein product [Penicillium manginii]
MAKQRPQGTSSGVLIITPFERSSTCLLEFKGLGGDNNSDLSLFRTDLERALARIDPIRDVNWRRSPKDCISSTQLRATHVQRFGHELPLRGYCERCANNDGPVASCAVTVMDMKPVFGGACADCAFGGGQSRCSFRLDKDGLPQYLVYILRTDNPEDGDTKESKKERTAPPSVPSVMLESILLEFLRINPYRFDHVH